MKNKRLEDYLLNSRLIDADNTVTRLYDLYCAETIANGGTPTTEKAEDYIETRLRWLSVINADYKRECDNLNINY